MIGTKLSTFAKLLIIVVIIAIIITLIAILLKHAIKHINQRCFSIFLHSVLWQNGLMEWGNAHRNNGLLRS